MYWVSPVDVTSENGASVVAVSASLAWELVVEESTEVNEDWLELGGRLKLEVTSAGGTEEKMGGAELCACVAEDARDSAPDTAVEELLCVLIPPSDLLIPLEFGPPPPMIQLTFGWITSTGVEALARSASSTLMATRTPAGQPTAHGNSVRYVVEDDESPSSSVIVTW